jgi:molecular chaperone GrpE (heat shock protein)
MSKASNKNFVNFFKSPTQHKNNMNKFSQSINQSNKNISESIKRSNARIDNSMKKTNQQTARNFKAMGNDIKEYQMKVLDTFKGLGENTQNQLIIAGVVGGVILLVLVMKN